MSKQETSSKIPERKDHFVPQAYLSNFCNKETKKIHIFDKNTDKWFETTTKNICFEYGWDRLDCNGDNTYLSDHLKALEPHLKRFLRAIKHEKITDHDRYYFATWLAIIFALSPVRKEYDYSSLKLLGYNIDPNSQDLIFHLRQRNLQQARHIGMMLYAYDWHLTYNFTDLPFITCDFPAHYLCLNDTIPPLYQPLGIALDPHTFLRIMPKEITNPKVFQPGFCDFSQIKPGQLTYGKISRFWNQAQKLITRMNEHAIFNAQRFIITSYVDDGLRQFVNNRKHKTTSFKPVLTQIENKPMIKTKLSNNFENIPLKLPKNIKF